jgi:hypothetical protein
MTVLEQFQAIQVDVNLHWLEQKIRAVRYQLQEGGNTVCNITQRQEYVCCIVCIEHKVFLLVPDQTSPVVASISTVSSR